MIIAVFQFNARKLPCTKLADIPLSIVQEKTRAYTKHDMMIWIIFNFPKQHKYTVLLYHLQITSNYDHVSRPAATDG